MLELTVNNKQQLNVTQMLLQYGVYIVGPVPSVRAAARL